ncbi:MAG: prenyltransferase/squalene oxidase repeat-containing protein, partial [Gemmatimonadaceae bacterium]
MQVTADVGPALRSAAAFVHAQRSADGLWRDAGGRAGVGSNRASAIVVWALGSCEGASEIVRDSARALLFRQHPDGGWAAGDAAPSDCDSTAWVLLALTRAPLWKPSAIERGVRYVAASLRAGPVNTGLAVQCLLRCGFARGRAA